MSYVRRKASFSKFAADTEDEIKGCMAASEDTLNEDIKASAKRMAAATKRAVEEVCTCEEDGKQEVIEGDNVIAPTASVKASEVAPLSKEYCPGNQVSGGDPSVSTLKNIIASLDKLADYCENNGEPMMARQIDMVSNTLEAELEEDLD